jgi:hypothetical protein
MCKEMKKRPVWIRYSQKTATNRNDRMTGLFAVRTHHAGVARMTNPVRTRLVDEMTVEERAAVGEVHSHLNSAKEKNETVVRITRKFQASTEKGRASRSCQHDRILHIRHAEEGVH